MDRTPVYAAPRDAADRSIRIPGRSLPIDRTPRPCPLTADARPMTAYRGDSGPMHARLPGESQRCAGDGWIRDPVGAAARPATGGFLRRATIPAPGLSGLRRLGAPAATADGRLPSVSGPMPATGHRPHDTAPDLAPAASRSQARCPSPTAHTSCRRSIDSGEELREHRDVNSGRCARQCSARWTGSSPTPR